MTCNNPKPDLVNINAYIKFGEILSIVLKILSGNGIMTDGITDRRRDSRMDGMPDNANPI